MKRLTAFFFILSFSGTVWSLFFASNVKAIEDEKDLSFLRNELLVPDSIQETTPNLFSSDTVLKHETSDVIKKEDTTLATSRIPESSRDPTKNLRKKTKLEEAVDRSIEIAQPVTITIFSNELRQFSYQDKKTIEKILKDNGFSPGSSKKLATPIKKAVSGKLYKSVSVLMTSASAVLVVEEFLFPELSFMNRILISLSIGFGLLLLFIVLVKKKIMR